MKTVICAICGKQFETRRPNKKTCSFSCKAAREKLQRMKWQDNNPHYYRDYMKEYRSEHKNNASECP